MRTVGSGAGAPTRVPGRSGDRRAPPGRSARHALTRRRTGGGLVCSSTSDREPQQATRSELGIPFESSTAAQQAAPPSTSGNGSTLGPAKLAPGTLLSDAKYEIQEVLGSGSNATTYRALERSSGREVAVKALSLRGLRDWKQLELFQREAQVLQSLSHQGIPQYLDYFEHETASDKSFYLVQEVAQGKSLAQMVGGGARATEQEVMRIAKELLAILQYLADLRPAVIHRDIKPENIVLEGGQWGGRVYLIDFGGVQGSSAVDDSGLTLGSTIVGTYGYMAGTGAGTAGCAIAAAPEQFRGAASPSSDLYSLGGTLLYLVSGQPPFAFPQERMRISYQDKVSVGPVLSELLDGLLEPVVEDRMSAAEALDTIRGQAKRRARKAASAASSAAAQPQKIIMLPDGTTYSMPAQLPRKLKKPAGSRVQMTKSGGKLEFEIPPEGLSGSSVTTGAFAVVWNGFVAFWTVSALASGGVLFALFSAPFWFAGWQLAGQAFGGALMRERFAVGRKKFRLSQELALLKDGAAKFLGQNARESEGSSEDLSGARLVTTMIVNGVPRTAIEVVEGVNKYRFGEGLQRSEQEWLVSEINGHLEAIRGVAPTAEDMGSVDLPKVVSDDDDFTRRRDDPFFDNRPDDPFRRR